MAIDGIGRRKADITTISGGLERKNLKNDQERSIFDAMDADHNGVLTDAEIQKFKSGDAASGTEGIDRDGDGVVSRSEAKKFIKANGLEDQNVKKQDVIDFLKKYGQYTQDIENTEVTEEGIAITYNDGSKKIINPETKDYKVIRQDTNTSTTTTTSFDANDALKNEVIENENEIVTTTFRNGDRSALESVIKEDLVNNTQSLIMYDETGKKIESEVVLEPATSTTTTYTYEDGKRTGKKVVQGTTEVNYTINGDTEVKTSMIENKGIEAKETLTTWTHNSDGTITEDITCNGEKLHTVNTLNEEGHRTSQTKVVDEATYTASYDGQGNTAGIVVQRNENLKTLAQKFNCSVEDLKKLNEGCDFKPGSTIKVPTEIDADDERLQNRKPADKIQAEIKHEQEVARQRKLARQRAEAAQLKKLGLINRKGAGQKITGAYSLGNGKGYREEQFTVIGQASFDRVIVRNKKGEIVVLSTANHKNGWKGPRLVLKTERVVNTETFRTGKKVKVGRRDVVITNQSVDGHGRMLAVDSEGREVVISGGKRAGDLSDRKILNNSYYQASNVADIYNDPKKREEAIKNGQMHISIVNGDKVVYTRGNDGRLWAFKIGENGKLLNQGAVNLNTYLDADARAIRSYLEKPQMRANDVRDIYNDPQKRDQAIKDGRMKVVDRNGQKFVQTRRADGNLWEFKVGAKGTLINEGIVNEAGEEEGYIRSFDNTPDISGVISRVSFSEMKGALDRVYSDDYSDTRDNFVTLSDGRTKVARTGLSPFEQYLIEDNGPRSNGRQLTRIVANAGGFGTPEATSAAIGRICAHEVNYELHGGMGVTHEGDVLDALKLCTSKADRIAAEESIKIKHPTIDPQVELDDEGKVLNVSYMRAVIAADGYGPMAVDRMDLAWVSSGAYEQAKFLVDENGEFILDAKGKPQIDPASIEGSDQKYINRLIDRAMFGQYNGNGLVVDAQRLNNEEFHMTADAAMNALRESAEVSDCYLDYDVDSEGNIRTGTVITPAFLHFRDEAVKFNEANHLEPKINGEPPEETFILGISREINQRSNYYNGAAYTTSYEISDVINLDRAEAYNRSLYGTYAPKVVKAEEAVLRARQSDNTIHLFQSDDPEVYNELRRLAYEGDLGENVFSLSDAIYQMHGSADEQDMALARAYIYGDIEIANAAGLALDLADRINKRSHGGSDAGGAEGIEIRDQELILFRELTQKIAQDDPVKLQQLQVAIRDKNYPKGNLVPNFDKILEESAHIGTATPMFYAEGGNAVNGKYLTDPAEIEARANGNMQILDEFSKYLDQLKLEWDQKIDAEGGFSSFANDVREAGNMGNTRRQYSTAYRQAREMQRRLELAAQGRLRSSDGTVISFELEAARCQQRLEELAAKASSYDEAQEYTKMAMVMAPIIIATAPVTTTGVATTAAVMGTSTAVFEGGSMLWEHETATVKKGTRGEVLTDAAIRTAEDAALGAAIPGVGKLAKGIAKGVAKGTKYVKKVARARRINNIRANRLHSMPAPVESRHISVVPTETRGGELSMLDANKRRLVENSRADIPTEAELRAYAREHAYQPLTEEQRVVLDQHHAANAEQYTNAHTIENLIPEEQARNLANLGNTGSVATPNVGQQIRKLESQIGGLNKKIRSLENQIKNAKVGQDTSKLQAELEKMQNARSKRLEELNALKNPTVKPAETPAAETPNPAEPATPATEPTPAAIHSEPTVPHSEPSVATAKTPYAESEMRVADAPAPTAKPVEAPRVETPAPRRPYSEPTIREVPIENNQILHADAPAPTAKPVEAPRVETPVVKPNSVESEVRVLPEGFKKAKTPEEAQAIYDELIKARKGDVDEYIEGNAKFFDSQDGWVRSWTQTHHETKWKMHIYANSPEEWSDAAQLSMPYLLEHNIDFKTVKNLDEHFKLLSTTSNGTQKGKAFTIYFRNEEEFLRTAEDLEGIFNQSGLRSSGKVTGEGQIGNSGFLSYRNSLGKRGTLAPEGMPDPWAQHVATRSSVKPSTTPVIEPVMVEPAGKVNYNQKILKLNNPDEIQSLRAEINASEQLSKKEKKILNDILNEKETALRARQLKPDTNVSFFDDEVRIVDDEVRIVDDEVRIVDDEVQIVSANNDVIIRPEVKLGNDPVVVDFNDRIRIGGAVDIDVRSLKPNFDAMAEGEEFFIGRSVNGPNDVLINNEFVSGKHLRVKKVNGQIQITDMSKNGTVLNTVEPDIATYSAERAERFRNATTNDYKNMLDENYNELRRGTYSHESSISHNTTEADLKIGVNDETEYWYWHRPQGSVDVIAVQDRISLNVVADKNLMAELDLLISEGRYGNPPKFIEVPKCNYKTPKTFDRWTHRHDPITMYFEGPVSPELEQAISEITEKYARQSVNGRSLMNALEGKPWIAHEANVKAEDAVQLWQDAEKLDSDLAKAIYNDFTHNGEPILMDPNDPYSWNVSAGSYNSAKKLINEYKLYHPEKNARILKPEIPSQAVTPEVSMPDPLDPSNPLNFGNGIIGQAEAAAEEEVNSGLFGGFFKFLGF